MRWCFVDHVLDQMGFGQVWIRWVQNCIATVSKLVLINGSLTKPFNMEKWLRQGDPLSPFLFILVAEVLNKMIGRAVDKGLIQGLKIGKNKVNLTHLQFADDTILFCPAKVKTLKNYKRILDCFGLMSDLSINYDKLAIISLNCKEEKVARLHASLSCLVASLPIRYLGIQLGANLKRIST